jgi:hypothetical protein
MSWGVAILGYGEIMDGVPADPEIHIICKSFPLVRMDKGNPNEYEEPDPDNGSKN